MNNVTNLCKNSLNRYIGNTYNKLRNKLIYLSFVKYPLVFLFNFVIYVKICGILFCTFSISCS